MFFKIRAGNRNRRQISIKKAASKKAVPGRLAMVFLLHVDHQFDCKHPNTSGKRKTSP